MHSVRIAFHAGRRLLALCVAIGTTACFAGVTTVYEGGPTVPIGHFMAAFFAQEPTPAPGTAIPPTSSTLPVAFPVATKSMRPGRLASGMRLRTAGWLASPMFLLGDDPLSRQWLATNRDRLHRTGAAGLVVNVASIEAFRSLRALAPEVPMAAGSVDGLAQHVSLSIYPLFVSVDGQVSQMVP
jgi:integrating conjugative element protein (TIGR03765 family)